MFNLDKAVTDFWEGIKKFNCKDRITYLIQEVRVSSKHRKVQMKRKYKETSYTENGLQKVNYYRTVYKSCIPLLLEYVTIHEELYDIKEGILISNELEQPQIDLFRSFLFKIDQLKKVLIKIEDLLKEGFPLFRLRILLIHKTIAYFEKPLLEIQGRIGQNVRVRGNPVRLNKTQRYSPVYEDVNTSNYPMANVRIIDPSPNVSPNRSIPSFPSPSDAPVATALRTSIARNVTHYYRRAPRAKVRTVKMGTIKDTSIKETSPLKNQDALLNQVVQFSDKLVALIPRLEKAKHDYSNTYRSYVGNPYGYLREKSIDKLLRQIGVFSSRIKEMDNLLTDLQKEYADLVDKVQGVFTPELNRFTKETWNSNQVQKGLFEVEELILKYFNELHVSFVRTLGRPYADQHFPMPLIHPEVKTNL